MMATALLAAKAWLSTRWRAALPWLALAAGILALGLGAYRWAYHRGELAEAPRSYAAGALAQDRLWKAAQVKATRAATAAAKHTEAAQAAVTVQTGSQYAHDLDTSRLAYRRVRDAAADRQRAAGRTDLSGFSGAASGVDGAAVAGDITVAAPLALIEEGDRYRLMVLAWQAWAKGVAAAAKTPPPVAGVENAPPLDLLAGTPAADRGADK